jgi:hypothetical protein
MELESYKNLQKQMQATIDGLTVTEEANNRTIQELREKQKQLLLSVDNQTKIEKTNDRTIQELLDKQKQLLDSIDNQTKTEESNKRTMQQLLNKQTQQTLEAMNQMLCLILQRKDVSTHKLEAATNCKWDDIQPAIKLANFRPNNVSF